MCLFSDFCHTGGSLCWHVVSQYQYPVKIINYWMLVATDFLSSRDISHILWIVFTSMTN